MSNYESNDGHRPVNFGREINRPVSLQFDPEQYRAELDGFDLDDAKKDELMVIVWDIMRRFVDLGFSVDVCTALLGDRPTIPSDGDPE